MGTPLGIIGAGRVGGALACRFAEASYDVRLGVRRPASAAPVIARCRGRATAVELSLLAAGCEVILLCVPAAAAVDALRAVGNIDGKIIVDCTNPVTWDNGPILTPPPEGSVAAALAAARPEARVVKGFNTFGAEILGKPTVAGLPADLYLAGDDGAAIQTVGEIAVRAGFAPVFAGPLRNAALLEALAVLWIQLATEGGQGRDFIFRLARR